MLLFEFDNGHLIPAEFGVHTDGEIDADVMVAVRDHALEIIGKPLFPVKWDAESTGAHAAPGDPDSLIAMDASGQVVTVEVRKTLDSRTLVAALASSGRTATFGWLDLANLYPSGAGAFRRDWNEFRESLPPRPLPGARLYIVTGRILDEVRPALELLADSGVEVFEVNQRRVSDGRTFVQVTEPYRITVPTISSQSLLEAGRRQAIESENDLQRIEAAEPEAVEAAAEPAVAAIGADEPVAQPAPEPPVEASPEAAPATSQPAPANPASARVDAGASTLSDAVTPADPVDVHEPHPALAQLAEAASQPLPLVWVQLRKGLRHEAMIGTDGLIALDDGRLFSDPSEAAVAASGRYAADGWRVWRIGEGGRTLEDAVARVMGGEL